MIPFWDRKRQKIVHYACFGCNRALRRPIADKFIACPDCARPVVNVGNDFPLPDDNSDENWETAKLLFEHQAKIEVTLL